MKRNAENQSKEYKKSKDMIICPECGKELPDYTEDGKHNFCPKSTNNGDIIHVCMECKMNEVVALWRAK